MRTETLIMDVIVRLVLETGEINKSKKVTIIEVQEKKAYLTQRLCVLNAKNSHCTLDCVLL